MALHLSSGLTVNSLLWISSLEPSDRGTTDRVHDDLQPYLVSIGLPFHAVEPKSASELLAGLDAIAKRARDGLRPIIHFDTHGSKRDGLCIAASREFVPWQKLVEVLRPINVATGNNLCVVSAACFGLHAIMAIHIDNPAPFFALVAPENTVSFGFVEQRTVPFYEAVFKGLDVVSAHEKHLAPDFKLFLCEKMLLVGLTKYVRNYCMGKGRDKRIEELLTQAVADGLPNTSENRRIARRTAKKHIRPDQGMIDRYMQTFLIGKKIDVTIEQIIDLARVRSAKPSKRGKRP
ncbi:MAG: hypothetical protein WBF58_14255 [Xanthobacteraceae bacterium]